MSAMIAEKFWDYIDKAQFDKLSEVLKQDAVIWCPNTREVFRSAKSFIEFNKAYPGRWRAEVEKGYKAGDEIINIAKVYSDDMSFYCISFFEFEDGKISKLTQYWGDNSEPPQWRTDKGWAERY